jgi:hypothetical protein
MTLLFKGVKDLWIEVDLDTAKHPVAIGIALVKIFVQRQDYIKN